MARVPRLLEALNLARIKRNFPILTAGLDIALSRPGPLRDEGVRRLASEFIRKQVNGMRRRGEQSAKGFAAEILASSGAGELDRVKHLGALHRMAACDVSRMDYVCVQWGNLLRLKIARPGLGLGSGGLTGDGISYHGRALTGLELLQTWGFVLNYGHLFGTFATERALLYKLRDQPTYIAQIVADVDGDARAYAHAALADGRIYQCAHALAAWRLARRPASEMRNVLVATLMQYLNPPSPRVERLKRVYKRIRQLSYLQLHAPLGVGIGQGFTPTNLSDEVIDSVLGHDSLSFETHAPEESPVAELLDSLDELHYRTFFTGAPASLHVLSHLRSFKTWWKRHAEKTVAARIAMLFEQPSDWPSEGVGDIESVATLSLPGTENDWRQSVEQWHANGEPWGAANFLISHLPGKDLSRRGLVCDVYAPADGLHPRTAAHVARILGGLCVESWAAENETWARLLWRSIGLFGVGLLRPILKGGLKPVLTPAAAEGASIGYAVLTPDGTSAVKRLELFIDRIHDVGRRAELKCVLHDVRKQNVSSPCIVFLGPITIHDEDGRSVFEIDGLWITFHEDRMVLRFLEAKHGKKARGGGGQLEDGVAQCFYGPASTSSYTTVEGGRFASVEITWSR